MGTVHSSDVLSNLTSGASVALAELRAQVLYVS